MVSAVETKFVIAVCTADNLLENFKNANEQLEARLDPHFAYKAINNKHTLHIFRIV